MLFLGPNPCGGVPLQNGPRREIGNLTYQNDACTMESMVNSKGRAKDVATTRPPPDAVQPHVRVTEAKARLDAHTREIVAWHFDPKTRCPFWLEYAKKLGWDPRMEVQGYDDLDKFPFFEDEWLRGGPVRRWVPKA